MWFRVMWFRVLWFRVLQFRVLRFRVLRFRVLRFRVLLFRVLRLRVLRFHVMWFRVLPCRVLRFCVLMSLRVVRGGHVVKMVVLWLLGDVFKTSYFVVQRSPVQFWACGSVQILVDVLLLLQVVVYDRPDKFL
ncbi:hypothetical protein NHX12_002982 [Muraenolepis orangiensis]|uniref:Uncharacterized protein n=1 Tax=Muraenolepis orangiensis TaxID=630683 RepID=A0A9Q0IDK8_9TELE|nr:hypothetical protein NHX12_002982 [Muraenolepis orangiensis]